MLLPSKLDKNLIGNLALPAMAFGISLLLSSHPTTVLTSFPMSIRRQFDSVDISSTNLQKKNILLSPT